MTEKKENMKLQTKGMKIEEYDRERKENMKQYETIHEGCEEYDRERKENMKLHTKGMKSTTEKEKRKFNI